MPASRTPGPLLRTWRERRRLSQLRLALLADISARHLSFLETGRARPSRDMILKLGQTLEIPLRGQDELLLASGFAPEFSAPPRESRALAEVRRAVELVVEGHEPYPALAVDRHWTLIMANGAAMGLLTGVAAELLQPPVNVLRLSLHPGGLAPRIVNLAQWRDHILVRLRHQFEVTADAVLGELVAELERYPIANRRVADGPAPDDAFGGIAVPLELRAEQGVLTFFSTTTVFGMPRDVTLEELAIESFFPANAATSEALRAAAAARRGGR